MSTAVYEVPTVNSPVALQPVSPTTAQKLKEQATAKAELHPLIVVGIAMSIATVGSIAFVGSIIFWLAIRHSGVASPVW